MRTYKPLPPVSVIRDRFDYSVVTGELYYKHDWRKNRAGDVAGMTHHSGRVYVRVSGERYARSRIVWAWVTGTDPRNTPIDHDNRDKGCDAWHNLLLSTNPLNSLNREFPPNQYGKFIYNTTTRGITYYQVLFRRHNITLRSPHFHTLTEAQAWRLQHVTPHLQPTETLL